MIFKKSEKHKWFGFEGSLMNLHYVIRVFSGPKKTQLTLEFFTQSSATYEFETTEERDEVLEKIRIIVMS